MKVTKQMKVTKSTKRTTASRSWRHTPPKMTERVPVGEWVADVSSIGQGRKRIDTRRKVATIGIYGIVQDPEVVINQLRRGKEVRFLGEDGRDWLRLYPCLNAELTEMFVAAQTLGDFRHSIADIPFNILKRGKIADLDEARNELKAKAKRIKEARRENVSPDTIVTCPECGTEFRVGKVLK